MKRQAIQTSIKELRDKSDELFNELLETRKQLGLRKWKGILTQKCLVPIINKTGCSDDWRFE